MDNTLSVSKGCFIFKNGKRRANNSAKQPPNTTKTQKHSCLLSKELAEQPFYKAFLSTWIHFQSKIEQLQRESNSRTMKDLIAYISNDYIEDYLKEGMTEIVPAAAVLTGINQSDHFDQFNAISQRIVSETSSSVCILNSRDCQSIKGAIESLVYNFIGAKHAEDYDGDRKRLRKSQCTIKQLRSWYSDNCTNQNKNEMSKLLVVILPDFECFNPIVLQDLISILSTQQKYLPFLLILGIATNASIIHNVLPYHITSKIKLRIFRTQAAPQALNDILEKVILSPRNVFHLSGKNFKFLTHVFLYYDFSIHGFIQSFKYCLMEHFIRGNCFALCTEYSKSLKYIQLLTHEDIEKLRQMLSFRPYVEKLNDCKRIISILTDDDYFKKKLPQMLKDCHLYFLCFHAALEFLYILVEDLPKAPLGKQRHQLYELCSSKSVVEEAQFRECLKVMSFMSREEFLAKITNAITTTDQYLKDEIEKTDLGKECNDTFQAKFSTLKMLIHNMLNADVATKQNTKTESLTKAADSPEKPKKPLSRQELKDHLLQKSKQGKPISEFNKLVNDLLNYIEKEIVSKHLLPLQQAPALHEIFIFTDIATIRRNIIGAPRSALHMSLNNPYYYLQCNCCSLSDSTQLLQSLPDISIVYKLHLECGRMINLFDWLQAFRSVVNSLEDDPDHVDPHVQARFTRAVAELQFLGYIKMSKRKTDHATRLTW